MKLKGVYLTLPVCDWRPFLNPASRVGFISPLIAERGSTYINGFGLAEERKKLRIPWRATDTIFFHCSGAISLPDRLPDGAPVIRVVRRVYLDNGPLVRFELAIFTNPEHHYPKSHGRLDEFARAFWESEVLITQRGTKSRETFATALPKLVKKFAEMTSPPGNIRLDLCRALEPQLQIIAEASRKELGCEANPLDNEGNILLSFRSLGVESKPTPVDTAYLTYLPGYFVRARDAGFDRLRMIRAHITWLHADLEILTHVLRRCILYEIDPAVVANYLIELAKGLRDAPNVYGPEQRVMSEFMRIIQEFHDNRISRVLAGLRATTLPLEVKNQVAALLEPDVSRPVPMVPSERQPLPRQASARSLNERLRYALDTYAKFLTNSGQARSARYGDEKFRSSAERKAEGVLRKLPKKLDTRHVVFVSVGGADGAELFKLLDLTGSSHGVLLEYADRATKAAAEEAQRRDIDFAEFTGDAMQKLDDALGRAVQLRKEGMVSVIAVTAHAVLHELETRSTNFSLRRYFSKLSEADVVIGREPVVPPNWDERVLISGNFEARRFMRLANVIRGRHDRFRGPEFTPEVVNPTTVELHRALAIETLTKAFYCDDFLYELEECISSISPDNLMQELTLCLNTTHSCSEEWVTSQSIDRFWEEYGLEVRSSQEGRGMRKPLSHMWYVAIKRGLLRGMSE